MNNRHHKPPKTRLSVIDRMQLARSVSRQFDGVWIGTWRGTQDDLLRIESALLLVKQHSPLDYARIIRGLDRIWIYLVLDGLGQWNSSLNACLLDERYVADPATSIEQIASTIVHEATHARIERCGIEYDEKRRVRIEAICFRREAAFAARLPDGTQLQDQVAQYLDWYQSNPDYFQDAKFRDRFGSEMSAALHHLGVPRWLIQAVATLERIVRWVRRLFR